MEVLLVVSFFLLFFITGLVRFLNELSARDDVYIVATTKLIDYMESPKTLSELLTSNGPDDVFGCSADDKKPRPDIQPTDTFIFTTSTTTTTPAPTRGIYSKNRSKKSWL